MNYDIKTERKDLFAPKAGEFVVIDVPAMNYLKADGHGNPNTSQQYAEVLEALFAASYAIRAIAKKELARTHTVGPLEGLWYADDYDAFANRTKDAWDWTMMIVQPEWITAELAERGIAQARRSKRPVAIDKLRFESLEEGLAVQIMHLGSYDDEGPVIQRMHHEFMPAHGLEPHGLHHEIYLTDARKTELAKLRTILRQPVAHSARVPSA